MRTRRASMLAASALLFGCGTMASSSTTDTITPVAAPAAARPVRACSLRGTIVERMARHRANLGELRWSAPSLEFDRTGAIALRIAGELDDCAAASSPPPRFLQMEEELKLRARVLASTARNGNWRSVMTAYHSLVVSYNKCAAYYQVGSDTLALEWPR